MRQVHVPILRPCPSLLFNNLTADEGTIAFVHVNQALLVPIASALSGDAVEKQVISSKDAVPLFQVRIVTLGAETFFVLCTAVGVQIYDGKGKQLMHSHALPEAGALHYSTFQLNLSRLVKLNLSRLVTEITQLIPQKVFKLSRKVDHPTYPKECFS